MKALTALADATPVRASKLVSSDGGGRNLTASDVLGLVELADLPQGDALPGQALIWNGEAWAPATVLSAIMTILPISPDGLPTGALWNNGGVICIA